MGLIKLAADNERGYDTKRVWRSEGKGLATGATISGLGTFLIGKRLGVSGKELAKATAGGAIFGAGNVFGFGGGLSRIKQNYEYAKRHGSKHPKLSSVFNPLTALRMYKHTPIKESLKQLDPVGMVAGPLTRKFNLKDQKK